MEQPSKVVRRAMRQLAALAHWLERGGSLAALQQMLGHSSTVTTQRYAKISGDMVRREVERLELVAGL